MTDGCDFKPELRLTPNIIESLRQVVKCENIPIRLKHECVSCINTGLNKKSRTQKSRQDGKDSSVDTPNELVEPTAITSTTIREVYRILRDNGAKVYLHEMLQGSELVLQQVKFPPRSAELEARIEKLKREQENIEYERITSNVYPAGKKALHFQDDIKSMNRQLTHVFNFVVTVICGFVFGFKAVEYMVGNVFAMKMMCGLICGTVVFFADLYFMLRYGTV